MRKQVVQTILGLLLAGFFMYLTLKGQPFDEIIDNIKKSRIGWLLVSGVILFFVFLFRALRWNVMLDNLGYKIKSTHILYYTLLGYLLNSITPKFGEVIRCTALAKDADIPVSRSFGSVIIERAYDVLVLLLGLVVIGIMEAERLSGILMEAFDNTKEALLANSTLLIIAVLGLIFGTLLSIIFFRKLQIFDKVKQFIFDLIKSVKDSLLMKNYPKFLIYTIVIWSLLAVLNYIFLLALPQTENLSFYFAIVVLFIGGLGWALPTPNGMGTTHYLMKRLFVAFNLSTASAVTFGLVSNGALLLFTILIGVIAVVIRYSIKNFDPRVN